MRFRPPAVEQHFHQALFVRNNLTGIEILDYKAQSVKGSLMFAVWSSNQEVRLRDQKDLSAASGANAAANGSSESGSLRNADGVLKAARVLFEVREKHLKECQGKDLTIFMHVQV
jgi:hypothetical protein